MERHFKHLSLVDRLRIESGKKHGLTAKEIAKELNVHISTIYRELKRGVYEHKRKVYDYYGFKGYKYTTKYSPDIAEEKYRENLKAKGAPLKIGKDYYLSEYIEHRIVDDGLTPLAVLGEIKKKHLSFDTTICVGTLYSYIEKGVFLRLSMKHLPLKGKQKKHRRKMTIARVPRGTSIEQRPDVVNERIEFGHWEMDCVCGSSRQTFLTLNERVTRKEIIFDMPNQKAQSVIHCLNILERKYGKMFRKVFKTITVDNGSEFSDCKGIEKSIYRGNRTKVYYCHPYSSYERGTNERMNREIRRKVPKGTDLKRISSEEVKVIENWINSYPRQVLDFATSDDLFNEYYSSLL